MTVTKFWVLISENFWSRICKQCYDNANLNFELLDLVFVLKWTWVNLFWSSENRNLTEILFRIIRKINSLIPSTNDVFGPGSCPKVSSGSIVLCHSKVFRMDLSYSDCQKCQNAEFEQTFEVSESVQPSAVDLHNLRPSNAPKNAQLWIHANIFETGPWSERLYLNKCKTLYNRRSRVTWSWI